MPGLFRIPARLTVLPPDYRGGPPPYPGSSHVTRHDQPAGKPRMNIPVTLVRDEKLHFKIRTRTGEREPHDDRASGYLGPGAGSVLAEIEGPDHILAQRILHESAMARGAEIEAKALVERRGEVFG